MPRVRGSTNRSGGGRIHPHERDVDNAPIIGASITANESHVITMHDTESHDVLDATRQGHRNRIKHVYEFYAKEYPDYAALGVRELAETDFADATKYWHKNKSDLVYRGFNVLLFKAFLTTKINKANGKVCSYPQIRKYFDAVLYGAKESKELLPHDFYSDMDKFLKSFRKQTAKAKKNGELDESEADPIPWSLYAVSIYVCYCHTHYYFILFNVSHSPYCFFLIKLYYFTVNMRVGRRRQ